MINVDGYWLISKVGLLELSKSLTIGNINHETNAINLTETNPYNPFFFFLLNKNTTMVETIK